MNPVRGKKPCFLSIIFQIYIMLQALLKMADCLKIDGNCRCGRQADDVMAMRIVGGKRALPHSHPWLVAIFKSGNMHCGGALVTDLHVIGAGHCVRWDAHELLTARLGLHHVSDVKDVIVRKFKRIVIHERFTSTKVRDDNDIAIYTMVKPVPFNDAIAPVCMPEPKESFAGMSAYLAGWGRVKVDASPSSVLLEAQVNVITDAECRDTDLAYHLTQNMICARAPGIDGCQGDSGGPMVVQDNGRYTQIGIISWGIGCADPHYPGVYTKVSNYIKWIKDKVNEGRTCADTFKNY